MVREELVNKIEIMKNAIKRTKSPYLKADFTKAIKRLEKQLKQHEKQQGSESN